MARPVERFCKWGHDTDIVGRDANFSCKECRRESDRRRSSKRSHAPSKRGQNFSHTIEWQRARMERWLEIVSEDPLDINLKSTHLRSREFESRYQKLEASLPTPVDA